MSAAEQWTDGRVVGSLFDNGGGLRQCSCGSYFLLSQADYLEDTVSKDITSATQVKDTELESLLTSGTVDSEVEIVARRRYWQFLNDPFRETYRAARQTDTTSWPTYTPSDLQRENMNKLLNLLDAHHTQNWIEMAELLRELGEPMAAQKALKYIKKSQTQDAELQSQLIAQGAQGPVRFIK
jgi:environmental stress-induced protein Ves